MKNYDLKVLVQGNGKNFELLEDFTMYLDEKQITVPKGFDTDFATIPSFLIPVFGLKFKYSKASVVHDYLYSVGLLDRKECDDIFYESMIKLGINKVKAKTAYFAVRAFGSSHYNKERE